MGQTASMRISCNLAKERKVKSIRAMQSKMMLALNDDSSATSLSSAPALAALGLFVSSAMLY